MKTFWTLLKSVNIDNQDFKHINFVFFRKGTLFTSPKMYDKDKSVRSSPGSSPRHAFIHALCLRCLQGEDDSHKVACRYCSQQINMDAIQIGTLYKFDLFAAFATCCRSRQTCSHCSTVLIDPEISSESPPSFSSFSDQHECPKCKTLDYHFVKPIEKIFMPTKCFSSHRSGSITCSNLESILDVWEIVRALFFLFLSSINSKFIKCNIYNSSYILEIYNHFWNSYMKD